ncbi:carbohydrate kinase family protein [Longilinea arvoryzae]|nr:carbohydrate kinase family protein [Longilinea arvoryzae]
MSGFRNPPLEVAVLGAAAVDWVARVNALPRKDGIAWADRYEPFPGGSGANMASAIAHLGKSVRFIGRLGDDEGGQILWQAFQADGVDTSAVRIEKGCRSASCFIAVDSLGEREIYCLGGVALYDQPADLAPEWFEGLQVLAIADAYPEVALSAIELAGGQTKVVFTPGGLMAGLPKSDLDRLLSKSQAVIVSRVEAEKISGRNIPEDAIRDLVGRGSKVVIVTLGERGVLMWDGESMIAVPACKVETIVDTTGAGDAFSAGFMVGIIEGMDWISAAKLGNAVSSMKIGYFGARNGVPNLQQAMGWIKQQGITR